MTDQEINIALAEVRGWKRTSNSGSGWQAPDGCPDCYPPNYCHDLNAMHDVWKTAIAPRASENLQTRWRYWLQSICRRDTDIYGFCSVSNAIARQRAEAFLRTFGKWSDSSDDKNALAAAKCL